MTEQGDRLVFPDGSEYAFLEKPADPRRDPLVMEFLIQPDAAGPPPHVHPAPVRETFTVTEGEFELLHGGDWKRLATGESLTVEPGTVHTFRNKSSGPVRIHNVHDPAHGFEQYMRQIYGLIQQHGFERITPKAALYMALLWREHPDTIRPGSAPMGAGMAALGGLARLMRLELPRQ
ncbi:MAG: cupin domain-containing protein [Thermoleophilaceae bacterium]